MVRQTLAALAVSVIVGTMPALAQAPDAGTAPAGSVGSTADGAAPATAASTSVVGRTKPPGAAADGTRPDLEEKSRALDRKIKTGICSGCK